MTQENRELHLRPARIDELAALTELCLRSKAVWGYDEVFMRACRAELTLAPRDLETSRIQIAESDGKVVGVVQVSVAGTEASLDKLFVEPDVLRTGAGRALFDWAAETARDQGARTLVIEADPGAAAFYRRVGARDDGFARSASIPGRLLPRLKLRL